MTRTRSLAVLVVAVLAAATLFWALLHQISSVWLDVALRPEVRQALERSLEDQKKLRALDPKQREQYRKQFDDTRKLLNHIEVLRMNRENMLRRFELALVVMFAIAALTAAITLWMRYRRAQERERAEYLDRVTSLQETARRHAHEIKGPLTAARLELERFADLARSNGSDDELALAQESVVEELDRLARFTRAFSSFGGLGQPILRRESLGQVIEEFCSTFANAWPSLALHDGGGDAIVCIDRDMLRQVLVNLCTNSARAVEQGAGGRAQGAGERSAAADAPSPAGRIEFAIVKNKGRVMLDVRDNGSGIPASLRARVFDPYVTTRKVGEGMGLGLSISRKLMLDHGGDLVLLDTSEKGTAFRLVFGDPACS